MPEEEHYQFNKAEIEIRDGWYIWSEDSERISVLLKNFRKLNLSWNKIYVEDVIDNRNSRSESCM